MAKKKLSPYEQAQRQFVQSRIAQSGQEATPELRARYRERFGKLAQEKEGRTKIAQRVLPDASAEERKAFKRTLASELPARNMAGTTSPTTPTTPTAPKTSVIRDAGPRSQLQVNKQTAPITGGQGDRGKYTFGQVTSGVRSAISNRRNNVIGQGINYPGRTAIESITNPFGSKGPITDWSAKGLGKMAALELGEAVSVAGPIGKPIASGIELTKKVLGFGLRQVGRGLLRKDQMSTSPKSEPVKPVETAKPATTTKPASTKGGTTTRGSKAASGKGGQKKVETKVEPAKAESKPIEPVKVDKPATTAKPTKPKGGTTTRGSKASSQKKSNLEYPTPLSREIREQLADPSSAPSQGLGRIAQFLEKNPKGELPTALRAERTVPKGTGKNDPFGPLPSYLDKTFVKQYENALELVKSRGTGWQQAKVFVRTQANIQKYGRLKGFK